MFYFQSRIVFGDTDSNNVYMH